MTVGRDTARKIAIDDLRKLIVDAAPDPRQAEPALTCAPDAPLDDLIPFSSIIVLGVVVAIEDRYAIKVTKQMLAAALQSRITLARLAQMIEAA